MFILRSLGSIALALAAGVAAAQSVPVTAVAPWVRATVQGQKATGAFMTLTAAEPLSLVGVASPVAGVAEVHEMKLDGQVMRMRAIDRLDLPAGQAVALRPGGYHVMLMDLKAPLQTGATVPLTLTFRNAKGESRELSLQVPVATASPANAAATAAAASAAAAPIGPGAAGVGGQARPGMPMSTMPDHSRHP